MEKQPKMGANAAEPIDIFKRKHAQTLSRLHNEIIKLLLFYYVKLEKLFSAETVLFTPFP